MGVGGITGLERLNHPSWVGLDRFERDLMYALSDPGHEAKLRNIRVQTVLTDLMNTDPYLKEKDPEEVIDAMNEIMEINPDLHKNKPMLRLALRQFLESGGMDIPTLGVLSEFGKEERERKSREREQAASTAAQHASQLQSELDSKRRLESEERRAREENETKLQISKQEIESREKLEKAKLKHEKLMEKLRHPEAEKPKKRLPRRIADALKDTATAVDMVKHPGQAIAHWWKNGLNDTNEHFESDEVRGTNVPEPDRAINDKGQVVDKDGNIVTINNEGKLEAISPHEYNVRQNMQQAVQEVKEREDELNEKVVGLNNATAISERNTERKRTLGPTEARRRRREGTELRSEVLADVLQEEYGDFGNAIGNTGDIPKEIMDEVDRRLDKHLTPKNPITPAEYMQHEKQQREDSQKALDLALQELENPTPLEDTIPLPLPSTAQVTNTDNSNNDVVVPNDSTGSSITATPYNTDNLSITTGISTASGINDTENTVSTNINASVPEEYYTQTSSGVLDDALSKLPYTPDQSEVAYTNTDSGYMTQNIGAPTQSNNNELTNRSEIVGNNYDLKYPDTTTTNPPKKRTPVPPKKKYTPNAKTPKQPRVSAYDTKVKDLLRRVRNGDVGAAADYSSLQYGIQQQLALGKSLPEAQRISLGQFKPDSPHNTNKDSKGRTPHDNNLNWTEDTINNRYDGDAMAFIQAVDKGEV